MNKHLSVKESLLHVVFGAMVFIVIGIVAVLIDMLSGMLPSIGVSKFTQQSLEYASHAMLIGDLVLLFIYAIKSGHTLIMEMFE